MPTVHEMACSSTLLDFMLKPLEELDGGARAREREPSRPSKVGSFQDYVECVLERDRLAGVSLRGILRDRGTGNFYQKFLELKRSGPLESEFPKSR